ncbi:hypothetical protein CIW48_07855 [Methylobacterium sp. P1-11]|uniref:hypothetical protein n=1 Tax=Methylobacterium sp. P1-11 TaxID=2024616 RepID=UPI0011EF62D0|nr:hypothetical protein [Methylobacterium sp. P1-11]KAA0124235.1 hypothetical protein CIW48_07855 [Methylobacterium sp. P1-11]
MSTEPDEAAFVAALDRVSAARSDLDPLAAGLLAALDLGLPGDSRAFARTFGVAHALVLRALAGLEEAGLVAVTARDGRTQRTRYGPPGSAA